MSAIRIIKITLCSCNIQMAGRKNKVSSKPRYNNHFLTILIFSYHNNRLVLPFSRMLYIELESDSLFSECSYSLPSQVLLPNIKRKIALSQAPKVMFLASVALENTTISSLGYFTSSYFDVEHNKSGSEKHDNSNQNRQKRVIR